VVHERRAQQQRHRAARERAEQAEHRQAPPGDAARALQTEGQQVHRPRGRGDHARDEAASGQVVALLEDPQREQHGERDRDARDGS
jgi:hypothetical protein